MESRWSGAAAGATVGGEREEVWSTGEEFKVPLFWRSRGRESGGAAPPTDAVQHGRQLSHGEGRADTLTSTRLKLVETSTLAAGGQRSEAQKVCIYI